MQTAETVTRTFSVEPTLAAEVRKIICSRVRLRYTEQASRVLLFFPGKTAFEVVGPADVIEATALEIKAAEGREWLDQQW